jgi:regulator of extracellular matrix RemA (YlzA/DUF370 family)
MMVLLGYKHYIAKDDVACILDYQGQAKSKPIKRMVDKAEQEHKIIDVTKGKAVKSIIVSKSGYIYLIAMASDRLTLRFQDKGDE